MTAPDEVSLQGLEHEEEVRRCPECGSRKIGLKNEERYCEKCGHVFD